MLVNPVTVDVGIVGAGIVGISAAYLLAPWLLRLHRAGQQQYPSPVHRSCEQASPTLRT